MVAQDPTASPPPAPDALPVALVPEKPAFILACSARPCATRPVSLTVRDHGGWEWYAHVAAGHKREAIEALALGERLDGVALRVAPALSARARRG
jgi:hypothetical protein